MESRSRWLTFQDTRIPRSRGDGLPGLSCRCPVRRILPGGRRRAIKCPKWLHFCRGPPPRPRCWRATSEPAAGEDGESVFSIKRIGGAARSGIAGALLLCRGGAALSQKGNGFGVFRIDAGAWGRLRSWRRSGLHLQNLAHTASDKL